MSSELTHPDARTVPRERRVVVGDAEAIGLLGLREILTAAGYAVLGATTSAPRLVDLVKQQLPGLLLLDLELRDGAGEEVLSELPRWPQGPAIVVYSDVVDVRRVQTARARGAAAFVPKGAPARDLLAALESVESSPVPPPVGREEGSRIDRLTARERQVLTMLAEGQSGSDVAAALALQTETVRSHVKSAVRRLGARSRTHAVALFVREEIAEVRRLRGRDTNKRSAA